MTETIRSTPVPTPTPTSTPTSTSTPTPRGALASLGQAKAMWAQAALEVDPAERYRCAHVSALRGAASVLAARPPARSQQRGRPTSAWRLLDEAAPELAEWSAFFRDSATRRAMIEAGSTSHICDQDADELLTAVSEFLAAAGRHIGVSGGELSFDSVLALQMAS